MTARVCVCVCATGCVYPYLLYIGACGYMCVDVEGLCKQRLEMQ